MLLGLDLAPPHGIVAAGMFHEHRNIPTACPMRAQIGAIFARCAPNRAKTAPRERALCRPKDNKFSPAPGAIGRRRTIGTLVKARNIHARWKRFSPAIQQTRLWRRLWESQPTKRRPTPCMRSTSSMYIRTVVFSWWDIWFSVYSFQFFQTAFSVLYFSPFPLPVLHFPSSTDFGRAGGQWAKKSNWADLVCPTGCAKIIDGRDWELRN